MSEREIKQRVTEAEYAATSATGDANITITNYYYREEKQVSPVDSEDTADESLPCPYRGLYHFGPNDAEVFFGREIFIEELYNATKTRNFIPVLGASGSGKSSVVLAGLVPKLEKEGHWLFTHFRPGSDPFHALALALVPLYNSELDNTDQIAQARKLAGYLQDGTIPLTDIAARIQQNHLNHRLLLIADQFEELYTLCNDEAIRRRFLDCLLACLATSTSPSPLVLVTTMRADFLVNALAYPAFADRLRSADIKIRSMNREELAAVIAKPVERLGVSFEAGLVERILDDVEEQPGNLPLLEFALTELWNKHSGKHLTHQVYEEIGQVEGALARHADEKYGNLMEEDKKRAERIFIQLVQPGEGTEDTRRIATRDEVGEDNWDLVTSLASFRLVVTNRREESEQETVEIIHEALIRNWSWLQDLLEDYREAIRTRYKIQRAAEEWQAQGKPRKEEGKGYFLEGVKLAEAEEFVEEKVEIVPLSGLAREFVEESRKERERLQTNVQLEDLISSSKALLNSNQYLDALVKSLRAGVKLKKSFRIEPDTRMRVITTLNQAIFRVKERNRVEIDAQMIRVSPDNTLFVSVGEDKAIKLWDSNGELIKELLRPQTDKGITLTFSPKSDVIALHYGNNIKFFNRDGTLIGSGVIDPEIGSLINSLGISPNGQLIVLGINQNIFLFSSEGTLIKQWKASDANAEMIFSPDGQTIVSSSTDGLIQFWNLNGNLLKSLQVDDSLMSFQLSPDGQAFASVHGGDVVGIPGEIKLWNQDGTLLTTIKGHNDLVLGISFSPDGNTIASASADGTIKLWNLDGIKLETFEGHNDWVRSVNFSRDGKTIISASEDSTVRFWNRQSMYPKILKGAGWEKANFSPDGKTIASSSGCLWSQDGTLLQKFRGIGGNIAFSPDNQLLAVGNVSFSADGQTIAIYGSFEILRVDREVLEISQEFKNKSLEENSIKLLNRDGNLIKTWKISDEYVYDVRFSPNNQILASTGSEGTIKLWDLDGEKLKVWEIRGGRSESLSFSPDGQMMASANSNGTVKLWSLEGKQLKLLKGHFGFVNSVSFSPDGNFLVSGGDTTVRVWSVNGALLHSFEHNNANVFSVDFSPDGKTIASGSRSATVILWNLDLDNLLVRGCNWVQDYLENTSIILSEEERYLCEGIIS